MCRTLVVVVGFVCGSACVDAARSRKHAPDPADPAVTIGGRTAPVQGSAVASAAAPASGSILPLGPHMTLSQLPVPGFRDAVVSHPLEARSPQAVIVALHGNYDRPEWQCEVWRKVAGKKPFILCPRGEPRSDAPADADRWTWGAYATVEREVDAAVAALKARFVTFVDGGPIVLVGFSLGATMAARLATRSDGRYSRLVVIEGGDEGWTVRNVRTFDEHGGDRVLAACGQAPCLAKFKTVARAFERAKFPFRLADGGRAGHVYDGPVADAVLREWAWLVEGDPRLTP